MNRHDGKAGVRIYFCRNAAQPVEVTSALSRLGLRNDVSVEAVPCSGRIDSRYLLKAFEGGADAVCVLACPAGDCKLMEGNLRASRRIESVKELLCEAGLDPACVQIFLSNGSDESKLDSLVEAAASFADVEPESLEGMVA